jgi:F-type H+-transporting ATPase subunit delta
LRELLLNPSIPTKKRVSILDTVNARIGCGPKVRNFLAVLISHERLGALREILEEYRLEMNRRLSISDAEVVTARPLGDQERATLTGQVAQLAGNRVHATFREDKSLIGGAIVRIGSTIYDGSVRGRLERLKERLVPS